MTVEKAQDIEQIIQLRQITEKLNGVKIPQERTGTPTQKKGGISTYPYWKLNFNTYICGEEGIFTEKKENVVRIPHNCILRKHISHGAPDCKNQASTWNG